MSLGPWQLAIIAILILVLFGRGKISEMMGDFGKGIKSFKKGMTEAEQEESAAPPPRIENQPAQSTADAPANESAAKPQADNPNHSN
jgi:sec-independent protein translocase protein TatA